MSLKQSELKAISWFCDSNGLKPQLSIPPFQMRFTNRHGEINTYHLDNITLQYKEHKKEESKRKKRESKDVQKQD